MSRNPEVDYTQFVHEFVDEFGHTRYAVARWEQSSGQFVCPLSETTKKLTGCFAEYAKQPSELGGYKSRQEALRRARYLFGEK
jgi:hypothetical protein